MDPQEQQIKAQAKLEQAIDKLDLEEICTALEQGAKADANPIYTFGVSLIRNGNIPKNHTDFDENTKTMLEMLMKHGATYHKDVTNILVRTNRVQSLKYVLSLPININELSTDGETALQNAVQHAQPGMECYHLLRQAGANPQTKQRTGETTLDSLIWRINWLKTTKTDPHLLKELNEVLITLIQEDHYTPKEILETAKKHPKLDPQLQVTFAEVAAERLGRQQMQQPEILK